MKNIDKLLAGLVKTLFSENYKRKTIIRFSRAILLYL
jgi:hypothetical protein